LRGDVSLILPVVCKTRAALLLAARRRHIPVVAFVAKETLRRLWLTDGVERHLVDELDVDESDLTQNGVDGFDAPPTLLLE
jgi:hypothetical protein